MINAQVNTYRNAHPTLARPSIQRTSPKVTGIHPLPLVPHQQHNMRLAPPQGFKEVFEEISSTAGAHFGIKPKNNPLLELNQPPKFKTLESKHWMPAIAYLIKT